MVELVDAPDSKSGGLRPLGVRVPLPALAFQRFSTLGATNLDNFLTNGQRGGDCFSPSAHAPPDHRP